MTRKILVPTLSDSFDERTDLQPTQFEEVFIENSEMLENNIWISQLLPKQGKPQWRIITGTLAASIEALNLPYPILAHDNYCVTSVTRIFTTAEESEWVDMCSFDGPDGRARHYQILSSRKKCGHYTPSPALAVLYCWAQRGDGPIAAELFRYHFPESVKSTCKQLENKIFLTEELPLGSTFSRFHGFEGCLRKPTVLDLRYISADWGCSPFVARYTIKLSTVLGYLKTLPAHRLEHVQIVDLQSTNFHDASLKYLLEIDALIPHSCVFNLTGTHLYGFEDDNEIFVKELTSLLCNNIVLVPHTFFAEYIEAREPGLPSDILQNENLKLRNYTA